MRRFHHPLAVGAQVPAAVDPHQPPGAYGLSAAYLLSRAYRDDLKRLRAVAAVVAADDELDGGDEGLHGLSVCGIARQEQSADVLLLFFCQVLDNELVIGVAHQPRLALEEVVHLIA